MKKLLTIASLFSFFLLFSQNEVAKKVQELQKLRTTFKPISVLDINQNVQNFENERIVSNATFATIKIESVNDIYSNKYENIELTIPYNGNDVTMQLYKVDVFSEGFHVDSDKQKNILYQKGVFYRGIVKGDFTSVVSFNFFNNEFNGIASGNGFSNLVIGKLNKINNTQDYVVYDDANLKVSSEFGCDVKEDESLHSNENSQENKNTASARCVTVYFELDYNLYQQNGNNTTTTINWMTSLFNHVQTLYNNDGITVSIKSIFIWTTPDPYEGIGTSSSAYLYKFNEVRPVFDGDVGQLVGTDPGGLGGVAVGINALCTQSNFSYSDVTFSYAAFPAYSFTVMVITHELGHLFGSRHTHSCVWNANNNTSIDGCGQQAGFNEGSCAQGPIPSTTTKGTIMSYCHLINGVGIKFSNGFGPQPTAKILNAVNNGQCLSTDCVNTCINTVGLIEVNNISTNSALITWADSGTFTNWQVAVYPFGSTAIVYNSVATNSYTATGLLPNTYYVIEVKPTCTTGLVSSSREVIFATSTAYCSGVSITDTGGAFDVYTNMENIVRVMIPELPNNIITLTINDFSLELDYDYLYIYDGNSTSATSIDPAGFTGTTIPTSFTSTAADGSLTMRFYSDQGVVDSGWVATTSCTPNLGISGFEGIDFTYYPNPTNGIVNINSKTNITAISVYNVAGQLLYDSKINDLKSNVDISAFANGTYFFKLKFDEKEVNFKVLKM